MKNKILALLELARKFISTDVPIVLTNSLKDRIIVMLDLDDIKLVPMAYYRQHEEDFDYQNYFGDEVDIAQMCITWKINPESLDWGFDSQTFDNIRNTKKKFDEFIKLAKPYKKNLRAKHMLSNGWHMIYEYYCFVRDGQVLFAQINSCNGVYYRKYIHRKTKAGTWERVECMNPVTLRRKLLDQTAMFL